MKRALSLAGVLMALIVVLNVEPTRIAEASQTCSTVCSSGPTLQCTTASGTCTSSSGTVTCCGQTYSCSTIDAGVATRNACLADCNDRYSTCVSFCTTRTCLSECAAARTLCRSDCPPVPQTNFSC